MISEDYLARWADIGVGPAEIFLPKEEISLEKWCVIACDQFSSERSYWDEVRQFVGREWSTLNMIIPECDLGLEKAEQQAQRVNEQMNRVLREGFLRSLPKGFVLVQREVEEGTMSRMGLVLAVDLECYSFNLGDQSFIRPTEGTIMERLPVRMDVRRQAVLDLPHILLFMDDAGNKVLQAAQAAISSKIYDFHLMKGGGRVKGWSVRPDEGLLLAFENLAASGEFLFAVGDGNHSLAAAKQIWMQNKSQGARPDDPRRYALVEVVNIHQPGVVFHPIHRVLFQLDGKDFLNFLAGGTEIKEQVGTKAAQNRAGSAGVELLSVQKFSDEEMGSFASIASSAQSAAGNVKGASQRTFRDHQNQRFHIIVQDGSGYIAYHLHIATAQGELAVERIQVLLDEYLEKNNEVEIDYVHGEQSVLSLVKASQKTLGLILPALDKNVFFERISKVGPYPKKAFSIGHAVDKRYYLEARHMKSIEERVE